MKWTLGALRAVASVVLMLVVSACCHRSRGEQAAQVYWDIDDAKSRLRHTDAKNRQAVLADALNPWDRFYRLFPTEVLGDDEVFSWTWPLQCSLEEDTRKRIYLIDVIVSYIDEEDNPPFEILRLGVELVPGTKSMRYSNDILNDWIDSMTLREELLAERERLTRMGPPARM